MTSRLRSLALGAAGLLLLSVPTQADDFPSKPVTLVVPWPAGGPTDVAVRAVADSAQKHLGQPIVIDNKGGGGGTVGIAAMAASAKPDGYTIGQIPITVFRLPLMQKTTWTHDDLTYIIHLTGYVFGIYSSASAPFTNWKELVAYAKANPGKLTYGTPGAGTSLHLGVEQIAEKAGIKFTHVPFKGTAEVIAAVAGGHVMIGAGSIGAARPLVEAGKARYMNIWTAEPRSAFPGVPTLVDLGYGLVVESPWGIAGPKGMPPKAVAKLHDAFKKAIEDPVVLEALDRYEMKPNYKNTADYVAAVKEQVQIEKALIDRLGLAKKE
ncbi:tripartite tricarboxylate transporter substrate binding protein [Bradyrhizobium sp. LHD-71]|uniref:tripartite tricarboxylate transporter substrate binding protein n=1 Tax=Bradyrhizobium sp. LHD-71 TaxID=3072141 RepID=UPI00280F9C5F|nr:tripartite tricarboxylate transporter substrate binding protein [Bradyrhizobium sp. LHD-71]MDQ8728939.1 tripartite tricarboxylate transporter substrate binding protein [Bradyrhizobium sp. LHD-71]